MTTTTQAPLGSGFGHDSTAEETLRDLDLSGTTMLVTGGASGIGLAATRALTGAGARVIGPARRPDDAADALAGTGAEVRPLDLSDLASVDALADSLLDTRLDVILADAGVMGMPETRFGPGWEAHFAINHLGHFRLVTRLRPTLAPDARVVLVSSLGHQRSAIRWDDVQFEHEYDRWLAYAQSKTANVLTAVALNARGVRAFATHPGKILTPLQRHMSDEEITERGWRTDPTFKTPEQGAATQTWAATSPLLGDLGGLYLEDCDVARPVTPEDTDSGVSPHAIDPDQAERLWELSERLIEQGT